MHYSNIPVKRCWLLLLRSQGMFLGPHFVLGCFGSFLFQCLFLQAPDQNERPLEKNCLLDATQRIRHK